jgi:hypothetical protein
MIIELYLLQMPQNKIAEVMGLTPQAVCAIVNSEVFQGALKQRKLEAQTAPEQVTCRRVSPASAVDQIQRAALLAVHRLVEMLDSEDERVVFYAAKDILDRAGYAASKQ